MLFATPVDGKVSHSPDTPYLANSASIRLGSRFIGLPVNLASAATSGVKPIAAEDRLSILYQHSHGGALFGNIKAIPFENLMDSSHAFRKMKHLSVQTATSGGRDVGLMIINEKHF